VAKKTEKKAAPPRKKSGAPKAAAGQKQPASIYTIMLFLSVLAMFLGCIFLALEMKAYDWNRQVPAGLQGSWQAPGISAAAERHLV
jgi:hypothetical protein